MCLSASSGEAPLPDGERPAERLAEQGPDALATGELLSVVLRSRGRDAEALALARRLLAEAGSLRALARMSAAELEAAGVKPAEAAVRLRAALALAERTAAEPREPGERLSSGDEVFKRYRAKLRDLKKERFLAIYLDQRNRVIAEERISEGSLTASPVNPREVFGPALRLAAAGVIFVHNHPSGDAAPSKEDVSLTRSLQEAGRLLGLRVLDHVVMGENDFTSMLDAGLMEEEVSRA
jgi:DNA repair protein RadC